MKRYHNLLPELMPVMVKKKLLREKLKNAVKKIKRILFSYKLFGGIKKSLSKSTLIEENKNNTNNNNGNELS
jgi:hypothetical protein